MYPMVATLSLHAAGGVGTGVIEAAKDANKLAIGVDRDHILPENVRLHSEALTLLLSWDFRRRS